MQESVRLVDTSGANAPVTLATGATWARRVIAVGGSFTRDMSFIVPTLPASGTWQLQVSADDGNNIVEGNETNNTTVAPIAIVYPDLTVSGLSTVGTLQGGEPITLNWTTANVGTAATPATRDTVYLSRDGSVSADDIKLGDVLHGAIAAGTSVASQLAFTLPVDLQEAWRLVVVTDSTNQANEGLGEADDVVDLGIDVAIDAYADLAVSNVVAPTTVIADPASATVSWTVTNVGQGLGRTLTWTDQVVYSVDDIIGNGDDIVLGTLTHTGGLAVGASYTGSVTYNFGPGFSREGHVVVRTDSAGAVWENGGEANNQAAAADLMDVMPVPYADLQVGSVSTAGTAMSGQAISVSWSVSNLGIGITNTGNWSDHVWLSTNPDGSGQTWNLGDASHLGQLGVGEGYNRTLNVTVPQGLSGTYYINVTTAAGGGPFEFTHGNNNTAPSITVPVQLSPSPDLVVQDITVPATAQEGALVDVSWTILNQGVASATGAWNDTLVLEPINGGSPVVLGTFGYTLPLLAGQTYTRTEQVRLPSKIEGSYRVRVITNSDGGLYEYGSARNNDQLLSSGITDVSLLARPDLRVSDVVVPASVTAGTTAGVKFKVSNQGPAGTSGRWQDFVYLSLDGTLSGDDILVGRIDSGGALNPGDSYASALDNIAIPVRYRGDAYIIVVADGTSQIDEYPQEGNNATAAKIHIDPVPFGDLVTSNVVAPDQAVHGSTINVNYSVANLGSATTQGDNAGVTGWTDSVWLTVDKTRPNPGKGDILIGQVQHNGQLAVGESYNGQITGQLPDNLRSGQYFVTVWSDTYNAILEDTLATNINPDDPNQVDNNNYKARPITVLGITPPDLVVSAVQAPAVSTAGGSLSYSYTVKNVGDAFSGQWNDRVWVANNPDINLATVKWLVDEVGQNRSLGNGQQYTTSGTVQLAPSVTGMYLVVQSDIYNQVGESNEANNARSTPTVVNAQAADLAVSSVTATPENFSGEQTQVSWTVTNQGAAVWAGTQGWVDNIFFSPDPTFIPGRATQIGSVVHTNAGGFAAGASYTGTGLFTLPQGTDGPYYIYVVTDANNGGQLAPYFGGDPGVALQDYLTGYPTSNSGARDFYATSAYEANAIANNIARGSLHVTYREPDLQVGDILVSDPSPASGQTITVTWTVTNDGTRDTRTNSWFDGLFLSRDDALDGSDYALVDRGNQAETSLKIHQTTLTNPDGSPRMLKPGESTTQSATFTLPSAISGDFHIIVKTDTDIGRATGWGDVPPSTIRVGLPSINQFDRSGKGAVAEFKDEGNNIASIPLTISPTTPPDLQVTAVAAPDKVIGGQDFSVSYTVSNVGGATPSDQSRWNDLIYLSKDRFLDLDKDRYVGYVQHDGGLTAGGSYGANLTITAPKDLDGPYYVFVITDPTHGPTDAGSVLEFGNDNNNSGAAAQPMLIQTPPPADLQAQDVVVPTSGNVGDAVNIQFTVVNNSINPAYGRWTDAVYLSSDTNWSLDDILLGKVVHTGDLAADASYTASLLATLPPLKDGSWHVIVRPDLYNEVFEGAITLGPKGVVLPAGEANNRIASAASLAVTVPTLQVATTLDTTLTTGQDRLYRVSVAAGQTMRITLDSLAASGANEVYVRWGDVPTSAVFDAAYTDALSPDQAVTIPTTQAGDYYILVRSKQSAAGTPVTLRADLMPLAITGVTPDTGGTGDDDHRWVTVDITGADFKAGALVKLSRPGVFEIQPERWQVIDATHIRAIFDLRNVPHGLYDVVVTNPDGQSVTEAFRYLVDQAIDDDVTIGVGGEHDIAPGDSSTYSVSLQSLTNIDTPYVRFDIAATNLGNNPYVLDGLSLPYLIFGSNVAGQPSGTPSALANTQGYGITPTSGAGPANVPWASLDGTVNTSGVNLAPGYAVDVGAAGFVGMTFNIQTYPGLAEWMNYDFDGLRAKLYAIRPDWKAQGLLDGDVFTLNKIAPGLAAAFLSEDPLVHLGEDAMLAMPFRFDITAAATPITRAEFVSEQTAYALKLRTAILLDTSASSELQTLAADPAQWTQGWLAALETAGLLLPSDEAPPIRNSAQVISLNATLATGILLGKGGDAYRTQSDLLGFFQKVQQWYGDTARYAGDTQALVSPIEYQEVRYTQDGGEIYSPVPVMPTAAQYDQHATADTHFINFQVFAGGTAEMEYLRHIGVLDADFQAVGPQALNLAQYLQQAAANAANASAAVAVKVPQATLNAQGASYVPAGVALPYTVTFNNPSVTAQGQVRIVTQLDPSLDPRSLRLGDLKIGDINIHIPDDRADFQGDFDFTGSKGYILRVSAGIDEATGIATWLLQAIDPDTGEVLNDPSHGLLLPVTGSATSTRGSVSYTVRAADTAVTGATIATQARVFFGNLPPVDSASASIKLDAKPPVTTVTATTIGTDANGAPTYDVKWTATDDASGVRYTTVYVADNGGDFKIWQKQVSPSDRTEAVFTGVAGHTYQFLAAATDIAGNREAASVTNAVLPDDGSAADVQQGLGSLETVSTTAQLPAASTDRTYVSSDLFAQAQTRLPGLVAQAQPGDLQSVLAPMTLRGFADGFTASSADIGALAMVQLADGTILASAGAERNEVFKYAKDGGHTVTPLFTLDQPGHGHGRRPVRPAMGHDRQPAAARRRVHGRDHRPHGRAWRQVPDGRSRHRSVFRPHLRELGQRHRDFRPEGRCDAPVVAFLEPAGD